MGNSHRELLRSKQGKCCCYCEVKLLKPGAKLTNGQMHPHGETIEHLHRRFDGGTNRLDNKALACLACNQGRGAIDWLTYTSYRRGELVAV